jgi:hypothetical protein
VKCEPMANVNRETKNTWAAEDQKKMSKNIYIRSFFRVLLLFLSWGKFSFFPLKSYHHQHHRVIFFSFIIFIWTSQKKNERWWFIVLTKNRRQSIHISEKVKILWWWWSLKHWTAGTWLEKEERLSWVGSWHLSIVNSKIK